MSFKCEVLSALSRIESLVQAVVQKENTMTAQLDALKAQVQETLEVEQSAIALIEGLSAQLTAIKDDPVAIQALADELHAKSEELASAVTTFTPTPPDVPVG